VSISESAGLLDGTDWEAPNSGNLVPGSPADHLDFSNLAGIIREVSDQVVVSE
jgi:hypothetical protein